MQIAAIESINFGLVLALVVLRIGRASEADLQMLKSMTWEAIAAWAQALATLLAVVPGLVAVWWQLRRQWLMNSATMISSFADRFTTQEWRAHRVYCARLILRHWKDGDVDLSKDFPVLGFFESIGHLVRRGVLDREMLWTKFGWYIVRYYFALVRKQNLIQKNRADEMDETLWEEFEWLSRDMIKLYMSKGVNLLAHSEIDTRVAELIQQELHLLDVEVASASELA